jgi:hypothetical protein
MGEELVNFVMKERTTKRCVGCGYCCITSPCLVSQRIYGHGIVRCPELIWTPEKERYICRLMTLPGNIGSRYRKELYAGAGCCSGLNSWRKDVRRRDEVRIIRHDGLFRDEIKNDSQEGDVLDPLFQKFLVSMAREMMTTSDALALLLHGFQQRLLNDGMEADEVVALIKRIHHIVTQNRSEFQRGFMG